MEDSWYQRFFRSSGARDAPTAKHLLEIPRRKRTWPFPLDGPWIISFLSLQVLPKDYHKLVAHFEVSFICLRVIP